MSDLKLYGQNLWMWLAGMKPWAAWASINGPKAWLKFLLVYILDIGANTLTGGDPRETISERCYVDRRQSKLARWINWLANLLFHPDGPEVDPTTGDDSDDNRELSGPWQAGVSLFWGFVVGVVFL